MEAGKASITSPEVVEQHVPKNEATGGPNDLDFLDKQEQPQTEEEFDPPVRWVLLTYLFIAIFTVITLSMSSYGVNGDNSGDATDYYFSTFGTTHFILAASAMTIFAIAYGVAYELHFKWLMNNARVRWELQMAIGTAIFWLFWFAGSIAQAAWLSKGQYCGIGGCGPLTAKARSVYSVLTVFAFFQWVAWTPLAVRAGVGSYRDIRKTRDSRAA